jgi:hypothetical protein
MNNKSLADWYSYQTSTGIKYANYSGYGMSAANIVNMESSLSVTENFLTNNSLINTSITAMSTVMDTIESSVSSFKSQLNNSMSALAGLENGKAVSSEITASVSELQTVAFSAMSLLSDALNTSVAGKYIFGAGSSSAPTQFKFSTLEAFQNYYDGVNISYPTTTNSVLSSRSAQAADSGNLTISHEAGAADNEFVLTADNGFTHLAVTGSVETTGNLTFSQQDNTLKSTVYGAFNAIGAGDTLLIDDADGNTKAYIVKSVSSDGKTITFSDDTPVAADQTFVNGQNNGKSVTVSTSFSAGTVVNFTGSSQVSPTMQIKSIRDDGSLVVTADAGYFNENNLPLTVAASDKWSMTSESYYIGGAATETFRVSDSQSITLDVSANDNVFNKLFQAFGAMAQGNLIQTDEDGNVTNAAEVNQLVNTAMDLLQSAIDNNGKSTTDKNATLSIVIAKVSANYVTLSNVNETLESVKDNLEDSIYAIKNVDQTEAAAKLLIAQNSLEASYQVLSSTLQLSLLDYLK